MNNMSEKKVKKPKYRLRLVILCILSFIVTTAPLFICFVANWNKYTKAPSDTVKLTLAGIIGVTLLALKVIGKLHMPRRIVLYGIVFAMAYLLKPVLDDLILLSGMALLGEFLDLVFLQNAIRKTRESIQIGKTADATSSQVEEIIKKYVGRV